MKPRSFTLILVLVVLAVALSACNAPVATPTSTSVLSESYEDALSLRNQLLLGSLRLQTTPNEITTDQAKALLPLWQAFKALSVSDTTATEETTAVLNQIQAAMTPAQLSAIASLKLTNAHLTAWYAEQGIVIPTPQPGVTPGAGKNSSLSTEDREATRAAAGTSETTATSGGGTGSSRSTILMDKVIEVLSQ